MSNRDEDRNCGTNNRGRNAFRRIFETNGYVFTRELADLMKITDKRIEDILMDYKKINKREGLLLAKIFQTDNDFWTRLQKAHILNG
ncbi:hypothetical protein ACQE2L_12065 [Escherichia coli]